jgi:integral membrane protein (TIGR00529 family)
MSFLNQLPALLKVGVVFILVLFIIRKKFSLGNAFLVGSFALSFFFRMEITSTLRSISSSVLYPKTLVLAVIVSLILVLSDSMEKGGQMQRLLGNFRGLIANPRLNLIIFPALIGLLPMPGGAVFSAPMVKELGKNSKLSGNQLSFINYWFRHIWEYWWPMYPGVLLSTLMADLNLLLFVILMIPITFIVVYLGRQPFHSLSVSKELADNQNRPSLWPFLREVLPIMIVIVPGLGLGAILLYLFPEFSVAKESGLVISLCGAIGWTWYENKFSRRQIGGILKNPQLLKMIYMVFAILIFKGILTDSQAVTAISNELTMLKIPLVLIAVVLPFIVGMLTGITIAFVGSTFPILIPLVHSHGESQFMIAYVMIALVTGFSGVLLSPLHLCLILSNEYFTTPPGPVYRYLWQPCFYLILVGLAYFWVLHTAFQWI